MTDMRPLCVKCQVSMECDKIGVKVKYSNYSAQQGDRYKCPICGTEIVVGFGQKYNDFSPDRYDYVRNTV